MAKRTKYNKLIQIWVTPRMADEFVADAEAAGMSYSEFGRVILTLWGQYKRSLQPQANGAAYHPEAANVRRF